MYDMTYELSIYKPRGKKAPFEKWLESLKDKKTRQIIQTRMDRAAFGNLGDVKSVGEDVFEFRIDFGPGFRVYFSIQGQKILLLLIGGDKKTQSKDIQKAKQYLKDWKNG
ncbi:MAG: addiction module protein [Bdellovibrionales bacterium RIFCSPHIGHO2_01_FULL_40_29]|nr:MAG: addiction module protein [Bdellovibrionales bacterium RIFCSPHIGHO2_01_FULL_40_29]OFZ33774.1 MAG: addiction module protein [Bdellovibrionales bacterium RIFCSPHIGHO2_02_FULL_40_15]